MNGPVTIADTSAISWRYWPSSATTRALLVLVGAAVIAYVATTSTARLAGIMSPWSVDGDEPQAVWQYWRYHVSGAFPPGDFLTDYAFVMHAPPVWWALMAGLSTVVTPLAAAKILAVVALVLACAAMWLVVTMRSNAFVGCAAVALMCRSFDFTAMVSGGFARSFGPALTLAFLGAFFARRHKLVLVILVLQAAFYPSVVMPCGIAYGAWVVIAGPARARVRRVVGMAIAGVLVLAFGKMQDLRAPSWWGPIVTVEQALAMPAWHADGRVPEVPLRPIGDEVRKNLGRPFRVTGHVFAPAAVADVARMATGALFAGCAVCAALSWWRRQRREPHDAQVAASHASSSQAAPCEPFPWEVVWLGVATFAAYLLARALAFQLYLPYRPLQHVWPSLFYAGIPLVVWNVMRARLPRQRAIAATLALVLVPVVASFGDGLGAGSPIYANKARHAKLYEHVRTLPLDATLAGELGLVNNTPLFSYHRSYVTRGLAHPFRAGFYAEAERRLREMYTALYATDVRDVVAFGEREHVDYLVYRPQALGELDKRLFQPVRGQLEPLHRRNAAAGFALQAPPPSAVLYAEGGVVIVSIAALRGAP